MAISKILKKFKRTKPKVKPKPKPKKKLSPMMKKLEVQRIKSDKFSEADAKRLLKYDDDLRDVLFKEAFRDLKATGGRVDPKRKEAIRKVTGKGGKKRAGPDRPKKNRFAPKPGERRPKPGDRQLQPRPPKRIPKPGDRQLQPRPPKRIPKPGDRRPKPNRMVLPPRPRKKPKPKLPESTQKLSPERKRKVLQLLKGTPTTVRKKKLLDRIRKM